MSNIKIIPTSYYTNNNERIVFIDGNCCDTIEKCYNTLQQQLSIPDYFGHNLDALEEVIADAEWIPEEKIHVVILNEKDLLKNDLLSKNNFLDIIKNNSNEKIFVSVFGK